MSNAVAKIDNEREMISVLQDSLYPGASSESVSMVLAYCRAASLDVMKKPVHIVPMWDNKAKVMRDVVMPGIALYRIEASRTGQYIGKTEPEFGPVVSMDLGGVKVRFPEWCKMTVRRLVNGRESEFTAKEYWLENYATQKKDTDAPNAMWRKRAFGQLAKCAEAQALRMAFPEQTGGTNTDDEMEGKSLGPIVDITPASQTVRQVQKERTIDHLAIWTDRLKQCGDGDCCDMQWNKWDETIQKAEAAGRPIAPETCQAVFDMIADRRADFAEPEQNAPLEVLPA